MVQRTTISPAHHLRPAPGCKPIPGLRRRDPEHRYWLGESPVRCVRHRRGRLSQERLGDGPHRGHPPRLGAAGPHRAPGAGGPAAQPLPSPAPATPAGQPAAGEPALWRLPGLDRAAAGPPSLATGDGDRLRAAHLLPDPQPGRHIRHRLHPARQRPAGAC